MPKVSIIMPAYNCAGFIAQSIESATRQTEPDLEVVVMNDGSKDNTLEVVQKLAEKDPRIKVFSQPNSGLPAKARNAALAKATGEYITFLDGDDLYHPEKLERQLSVFKSHPEVSLVFHETKLFHQDPDEQPGIYYAGRVNFLDRAKNYLNEVDDRIYLCKENYYNFMSLECNVFLTCAVMFPRQLLEKEKVWFPEIELGEDTDLWFRLVKGRRQAFIDEPLAYYRQVPGSQSSPDDRRARMLVLVMSANLKRGWEFFSPEERKRYHQKIAEDYFNLGYLFHRKGQGGEARKAYRQAFLMNPRLKTAKAYMATFLSGRKG